jgi:hypothetical protein
MPHVRLRRGDLGIALAHHLVIDVCISRNIIVHEPLSHHSHYICPTESSALLPPAFDYLTELLPALKLPVLSRAKQLDNRLALLGISF